MSGNRALWIRYTGGNLRDWQLMTATTTRKTPKQLRFVEQDVDLPSPFAIGDSTAGLGIPYAAGKEVVLLGANGVAVFKAHGSGQDRRGSPQAGAPAEPSSQPSARRARSCCTEANGAVAKDRSRTPPEP